MSLSVLFHSTPAPAQTATRQESIVAAHVWVQPPWIANNFQFSNVDLLAGQEKAGWELQLEQKPVTCRITDKDLDHVLNGMTNKFYCSVADSHSVKFKYDFSAGEITSEILGSRLFWALGFGADRVYPVEALKCFGCTADPFKDHRLDPATLQTPRDFYNVSVERKFAEHYIGRGWTFKELMATATKENRKERDALRLLSVFVQHADNKAENQDLACDGVKNEDGGCSGQTFMLIQDLGATFGSGQINDSTMSKAVFKDWRSKPIWKDHKHCIANLGLNSESQMSYPKISEEARAFLANLLQGFSAGPEGRKRVEDLFTAGHADWRGGTIQEWADAFDAKVKELGEPCSH